MTKEFMQPKFYFEREPFHVGGDFAVRILSSEHKSTASLKFEPRESNAYVPVACHIDETQAQEIMDQLWAGGIRPTQAAGSAGSLAATEKHLSDMRAIVSNQLGVTLK